MNTLRPHIETLQKTCFIVTAYVSSRVMRRDFHTEVQRIEQQPKRRSFAEAGLTAAVFFALALLAASFGWIGLGVYFLAVLVLFH